MSLKSLTQRKFQMNGSYAYEQDGPAIEKNLLLQFVLKRLDELLENNCSKMSIILEALSLVCVAHDPEANKNLNELFFPSTLVKNCRDILSRVSFSDTEHALESFEETPFRRLSERESRQVLLSAMREVKRITANQDFEFIPIIEILGWIALQPYPKRLQEFEAVWELGLEPAHLMQEARHILWEAYRNRDEDDPYRRENEPAIRPVRRNHD
jgi:hypothetical protein